MTDRPILFSGPMVRAILAGDKTQTRRVLPVRSIEPGHEITSELVNYYGDHRLGAVQTKNGVRTTWVTPVGYAPGDRLYVREAWAKTSIAPIIETIDNPVTVYRSCDNRCDYGGPWKPGIHMFRRDSRITLIVENVRVERIREITCADAIAEGIQPSANSQTIDCDTPDPRDDFKRLWDSLNAKRGFGWEVNPWVVAITFRVVKQNIDTLEDSP